MLPTKINYVTGDATSPIGEGPKIIAHVCNNIGVWGAGFVMALSNKWSVPEQQFKKAKPKLGSQIKVLVVENNLYVANMVAQEGVGCGRNYRPPIRYTHLARCLGELRESCLALGASAHMPRIGCGLAGGKWEFVEQLIQEALCDHGVSTTVYDLPAASI